MSDIGTKPHEFPRVSLADFEVGVRETIHQRFDNLAAAWKFECGHDSFLTDLVIHPAYQQIIGMGEPAVPLLLEEMRTRPDHWDWALRAITGCDPVPKESWGKLREIAAAWVTWENRGVTSIDDQLRGTALRTHVAATRLWSVSDRDRGLRCTRGYSKVTATRSQ